MAKPGAKPKAAHLRLVDGSHRTARHGPSEKAKELVDKAQDAFGKLQRPVSLKGDARKAWDRYIAPAAWLDGSREAAAIAFCQLWSEFIELPSRFPASKHGQMRAYMSELGLTDERNRGDFDDGKEPDEFFGD